MVAILGIVYVLMLNKNATKGYTVRQLVVEQKNLDYQNSLLTIRIAEAESLATLTSYPILSEMEIVETPKYLVYKEDSLVYKP